MKKSTNLLSIIGLSATLALSSSAYAQDAAAAVAEAAFECLSCDLASDCAACAAIDAASEEASESVTIADIVSDMFSDSEYDETDEDYFDEYAIEGAYDYSDDDYYYDEYERITPEIDFIAALQSVQQYQEGEIASLALEYSGANPVYVAQGSNGTAFFIVLIDGVSAELVGSVQATATNSDLFDTMISTLIDDSYAYQHIEDAEFVEPLEAEAQAEDSVSD